MAEVNRNYRAEKFRFVWLLYLTYSIKREAVGSDSWISSVSVRNVGSRCNGDAIHRLGRKGADLVFGELDPLVVR
jgi:hypothetical protein